METKLHQGLLLANSYGFYVKNRNRFYSYQFHIYVVFYITYVNYLHYVKVEMMSKASQTTHGDSG